MKIVLADGTPAVLTPTLVEDYIRHREGAALASEPDVNMLRRMLGDGRPIALRRFARDDPALVKAVEQYRRLEEIHADGALELSIVEVDHSRPWRIIEVAIFEAVVTD